MMGDALYVCENQPPKHVFLKSPYQKIVLKEKNFGKTSPGAYQWRKSTWGGR
jgi:hypothetical protein